MNKPSSYFAFAGFLLLMMGPIFVLCGFGAKYGFATIRTSVGGDPITYFIVGGIIATIIGGLLCAIAALKTRCHMNLLKSGMEVAGHANSEKIMYFTRFGSEHPYIMYYTYDVDGVTFTGKSGLLWDTSKHYTGCTIKVFVDQANPRRNAAQL